MYTQLIIGILYKNRKKQSNLLAYVHNLEYKERDEKRREERERETENTYEYVEYSYLANFRLSIILLLLLF
jgi:hypothetical protein